MDLSVFLSKFGKRIYLPNGITVQSAEAKKQATRHNATAGVAKENGKAMFFPSFMENFSDSLDPDKIFLYAPMGGIDGLRTKWAEEMVKKNPSMEGKKISKPIVTCGVTNALSIVSRLFVSEGDTLVLPNLYWENYDLIFGIQNEANIVKYEMFDNEGFNIKGFDEAIASVKSEKVAILLNFPNNPTGYSPNEKEATALLDILKKYAQAGKKIVAIFDDAYFGLFYEKDVYRESLFAKACDLDENILAIKCDGATKEEMVWGFRVGFITYGSKGANDEDIDTLTKKTLGAIRGNVSNCSTMAQNIILNGLNKKDHDEEKKVLFAKLEEHYKAMKAAVEKHKDCKSLKALPFNSGYFMSFETKCKAEELRHVLLDKYNTGTIAIGENVLRVTFSSVNASDMEDLIDCVCKAADSLC